MGGEPALVCRNCCRVLTAGPGFPVCGRNRPKDGLPNPEEVPFMIVLGVLLLIIGFLANIAVLWTIGLVLLVVGGIFAILGGTGRRIGGRPHWY
jgi:hypothetical protein